MKTDLIQQFDHVWRVFRRLVSDFDPQAWTTTGRKAMTPARLSLHIVQSTCFFMKDNSPSPFLSDKPNEWAMPDAELPTQADILTCIEEMKAKTRQWVADMDLEAENTGFEWAGKTQFGLVLATLRHNLFHIGELSSLLNESKNGDVPDHYVLASREQD